MGSVATSSFSVANLLQSLTSGSPQLSSTLSSTSVQTALQNAPASDLVELSSQAVQLQEADLLFGGSSTAATTTPTIPSALDPLSTLLSSLESTASPATATGAASTGTTTTPSTASLANQLAGYQSDMQSEEMQSLFGLGQTSPALSNLFNVLG